MGRYLDALKKTEKVGGDYPNKPKELEKGGILGLLGDPSPRFEINNAAGNETPSQQEQADLARLVARVCHSYDCPDSEISEAIETALADYDAALTCYTSLAKQAGMSLNDDRRMCFECAELSGSYCMAARRGELPDADRSYEPIKYLPRRCQGYKKPTIRGDGFGES